FQTNDVPGVKPYEEPGYWRDVGTIETYWQAQMDLLGESPRLDLDNHEWPIRTGAYPGPPAPFLGSDAAHPHVARGSLVKRATIRNSILGRSVWVNEGAVIEDSIIMDHTTVGKGAHIRRAVVDRFNIVAAGSEIGLDPDTDRRRWHVDASGIVVMPRGGRPGVLLGLDEPCWPIGPLRSTGTSTSRPVRTRGWKPSRSRTPPRPITIGTSGSRRSAMPPTPPLAGSTAPIAFSTSSTTSRR